MVESWGAFVEMRKKIRKPLTEKAAQMIFRRLLESEAKPSAVLDASVMAGWSGVFPESLQRSAPGRYPTRNERLKQGMQDLEDYFDDLEKAAELEEIK